MSQPNFSSERQTRFLSADSYPMLAAGTKGFQPRHSPIPVLSENVASDVPTNPLTNPETVACHRSTNIEMNLRPFAQFVRIEP